MTATTDFNLNQDDQRFRRAALWAFGAELLFFLSLGLGHLNYFRNKFDSADLIETQILQMPANAHLSGEQATTDEDEVIFNPKHPHRKVIPKEPPKKAEEQNQVDQGPDLGPTHGPVALYAPAPVIPKYLRDQNLKTSVVIEFLITAQGLVTTRLLDSSGTEELDAIALDTVSKWKFKPAAQNNAPIDSKTRLRIVFEVQ
jgi:TonB family protein